MTSPSRRTEALRDLVRFWTDRQPVLCFSFAADWMRRAGRFALYRQAVEEARPLGGFRTLQGSPVATVAEAQRFARDHGIAAEEQAAGDVVFLSYDAERARRVTVGVALSDAFAAFPRSGGGVTILRCGQPAAIWSLGIE